MQLLTQITNYRSTKLGVYFYQSRAYIAYALLKSHTGLYIDEQDDSSSAEDNTIQTKEVAKKRLP